MNRTTRRKALHQVLEGSIDTPAAVLNGLMLQATPHPETLVQKWITRAKEEMQQVLSNAEVELGSVEVSHLARQEKEKERYCWEMD